MAREWMQAIFHDDEIEVQMLGARTGQSQIFSSSSPCECKAEASFLSFFECVYQMRLGRPLRVSRVFSPSAQHKISFPLFLSPSPSKNQRNLAIPLHGLGTAHPCTVCFWRITSGRQTTPLLPPFSPPFFLAGCRNFPFRARHQHRSFRSFSDPECSHRFGLQPNRPPSAFSFSPVLC